jgi:hypothetical protein
MTWMSTRHAGRWIWPLLALAAGPLTMTGVVVGQP